jgi:hypothetical protein
MRANTYIQIILLLFLWLPATNVTGQTLYFPISGNSTDDFSSPFGSRNLGSANYPNTGYDYDFHGGIDIGNTPQGTNVYALFDGVVLDKGSSWVTVSKSAENGIYFKFHHLQNISVNINDPVTGGVTKLGETDTKYINNTMFNTNADVFGCSIQMQNIYIYNGADVYFHAADDIEIVREFEVTNGSSVQIGQTP